MNKMEIWCGRSSDGKFRIRVSDNDSNTEFLSLEMTAENFAYMLSNQPVECEGQWNNIHLLGKKHTRVFKSALYRLGYADKDTVRAWLKKLYEHDGWQVNDSLSAQNSIVYNSKDETYTINFFLEKWE